MWKFTNFTDASHGCDFYEINVNFSKLHSYITTFNITTTNRNLYYCPIILWNCFNPKRDTLGDLHLPHQ